MKRNPQIIWAALTTIALVFGPAGHAGQPEACLASEPATLLTPNPCTYRATVNGGIDAVGEWVVRIVRPVGKHGVRLITIDSRRLPSTCVRVGPRDICPIGTIKPGDAVTSHALATGSFVGTGNPCPVPNPGAPPPIAGGRC
jgi:hypothetical protein